MDLLLYKIRIFYPFLKLVRGRFLRDGPFFRQDIFFLGYFDRSDHIFNDGLVLEASDRTLHLVEIPKMTKNGPQNSLLGGL